MSRMDEDETGRGEQPGTIGDLYRSLPDEGWAPLPGAPGWQVKRVEQDDDTEEWSINESD